MAIYNMSAANSGEREFEFLSPQSGWRHPSVAEEFDYRADVWALLNAYAIRRTRHDPPSAPAWFNNAIGVMLKTLWAFADPADAAVRIESRRLRRLLIWHWQKAAIMSCSTMESCASILFEKPSISFAGPSMELHNSREFLRLDKLPERDLEIAVLVSESLRRIGLTDATPLDDLIEGLRTQDPRRIERVVIGVRAQLGLQ